MTPSPSGPAITPQTTIDWPDAERERAFGRWFDELAPRVRKVLNRSDEQLPLACVLEGGTWAAGRSLAQRLREGAPPLQIESDGTVF